MSTPRPFLNPAARHAFRRSLHAMTEAERKQLVHTTGEDVAFFFVSFASAFVILYGLIA